METEGSMVLEKLATLGTIVFQAFFLYLMGRIFHAGKDLHGSVQKSWQRIATEIALAVLGVIGLAFVFVLFM